MDLAVDATFTDSSGGLFVGAETAPFVTGLESFDGSSWSAVALEKATCKPGCRVRYRFHLASAAERLADVDTAVSLGGALFSPPSEWLVRPTSASPNTRFRFHVESPPGLVFVSGVRRLAGAENTYEASTDSMDESSYSGFGAFRVARVGEPDIELACAPQSSLPSEVVQRWIRSEVDAIGDYLGRTPDDRIVVFLTPGTSEATRGKTLGGGGASVFVRIGTSTTAANVESDDWVVAHELVHVGLPEIEPSHPWFSEGLASYVEPVARARKRIIEDEKFWLDLVQGLPQGLPATDDRGLDEDHEWGRVYWGGSLYFLMAEIAIREKTNGARELRDAVRGMADSANVETGRPFDELLDAGDRATGTTVLRDLYRQFGRAPGNVDLDALFARLGVKSDGSAVRFDDAAPLASLRRAITQNPPRTPARTSKLETQ